MLKWLRARADRRADSPAQAAQVDQAERETASPPAPTLEVLVDAQRFDEARALAQTRTQADSQDAGAWRALAQVETAQGRGAQAQAAIERALAAAPHDAATHALASAVHQSGGRRKDAALALRRALEIDPQCAEALLQSGLVEWRAGRLADAQRLLSAATRARPPTAQAYYELGNLHLAQGRKAEAEQAWREALRLRPVFADALNNLGSLLKDSGRSAEADRLLSQAIEHRPRFAHARLNLGLLRMDQQRYAEAIDQLDASLDADPKQADAHYWLGNARMALGDAKAAQAAYQAAIRLDSGQVRARWGALMAQLPAVAESDAAARAAPAAFERELSKLGAWIRAHRPAGAYMAVGAQQPFYLAYLPGNHRKVLENYGRLCAQLMAQWSAKVGVPAPAQRHEGRCRIGIVSSHLHNHSVWNAIVRGWVEHLDRSRFEIQLFHTGSVHDEQTAWAERRIETLHRGPRDWPAWAQAISKSRPDVLLYPEIGMDATTLRLASLRLARVQLAAWGHPITTGLPTIDGYLSAEAFEPPGAADHYSERLHALPRLGCCYLPFGTRAAAFDLESIGIAAGERVLVSPGTPFKYAPTHDALWVEVARRCRPCKLVFFHAHARELSAPFERRLAAAFEQAGLDFGTHVRFVPWMNQEQFFGLLSRCRAMLDSPGFSGFNTAMQAVECGTPIVAWEGDAMRSRFASGIARSIGLDDCVAMDHEAYADLAARLCADDEFAQSVRQRVVARRTTLMADQGPVDALASLISNLAAAR